MVSNQNCILAKAEIHKLLKLLFLWDFCFSEKSIKTLGALCQWFVSVLTTVAEFPEDTVCHWLSGGCAHITQERGDPKASSRTPLYGFVSCWKASLLLGANWKSWQLFKQKVFPIAFASSFKVLFCVAWKRRWSRPGSVSGFRLW